MHEESHLVMKKRIHSNIKEKIYLRRFKVDDMKIQMWNFVDLNN